MNPWGDASPFITVLYFFFFPLWCFTLPFCSIKDTTWAQGTKKQEGKTESLESTVKSWKQARGAKQRTEKVYLLLLIFSSRYCMEKRQKMSGSDVSVF